MTPNIDEPLSELRFSTTNYYSRDGLAIATSLTTSAGALGNLTAGGPATDAVGADHCDSASIRVLRRAADLCFRLVRHSAAEFG